MNIKKLIIASVLVGSQTIGFAIETINIDEQIAQIQESSNENRHTLMNELKERIASMNENDRADAMSKIQEFRQNEHSNGNKEMKNMQHGMMEREEHNVEHEQREHNAQSEQREHNAQSEQREQNARSEQREHNAQSEQREQNGGRSGNTHNNK